MSPYVVAPRHFRSRGCLGITVRTSAHGTDVGTQKPVVAVDAEDNTTASTAPVNTIESRALTTTSHLPDFFLTATPGGPIPPFSRLLEYVQVPSRFVGTETELNPQAFNIRRLRGHPSDGTGDDVVFPSAVQQGVELS